MNKEEIIEEALTILTIPERMFWLAVKILPRKIAFANTCEAITTTNYKLFLKHIFDLTDWTEEDLEKCGFDIEKESEIRQ